MSEVMPLSKEIVDEIDVPTKVKLVTFLRREAQVVQLALDGEHVDEFKKSILANVLPSPELTEDMIQEAIRLGQFIALHSLLVLFDEQTDSQNIG